MFYLLQHSPCPPGEFYLRVHLRDGVETISDAVGSGDTYRQFGPWPQIEMVADELIAFRKANGLPGANRATAVRDVDAFTCHRLGNSARWCRDTERAYAEVGASPRQSNPGGGCCGHRAP